MEAHVIKITCLRSWTNRIIFIGQATRKSKEFPGEVLFPQGLPTLQVTFSPGFHGVSTPSWHPGLRTPGHQIPLGTSKVCKPSHLRTVRGGWILTPQHSCGSFLKITGVFLSSPQALAAVQPEASFLTGPKGCVQHPAPPGSAQTRRRWVAAGWLMTVGSLSPALPWPFSSQGWSTERARLSPQ